MKNLESPNQTDDSNKKAQEGGKIGKTIRAAVAATMLSGGLSDAQEASAGSMPIPKPRPNIEKTEQVSKNTMSKEEFNSLKKNSVILWHINPSDMYEALQRESSRMTKEQDGNIKEWLKQRGLLFEIALNANSLSPREGHLLEDESLHDISKVNRHKVVPLVVNSRVDSTYWSELEISFIEQDTAGRKMFKKAETDTYRFKLKLMKDLAEEYGGINPIEVEQSAAYVTRNLYARGLTVNDTTVTAEVNLIKKRRNVEAYNGLFGGNVLLLSHDQIKNGPTFATEALKSALREQIKERGEPDAKLYHITPLFKKNGTLVSTPESLAKAKRETLRAIRTSLSPLTVFFDGHGSKDAIYISTGAVSGDGVVENDQTIKIDTKELAQTLIERHKNQIKNDQNMSSSNISFVFSSCFSQNFGRAVAKLLQEAHVPLPKTIISASEYNQYGFYGYAGGFGSYFLKLLSTSPNLGEILNDQNLYPRWSKPSIFVPDKVGNREILMQLGGIVIPQSTTAIT